MKMPKNLNYLEASTLCCAGLTAWNALYGLEGKPLKVGEFVLTQGTGGVSIFALQFAKAAGATVIATTSSAEKAETLELALSRGRGESPLSSYITIMHASTDTLDSKLGNKGNLAPSEVGTWDQTRNNTM